MMNLNHFDSNDKNLGRINLPLPQCRQIGGRELVGPNYLKLLTPRGRTMGGWLFKLFALLWCLQCISGSRILAFLPMPWRSHQHVFQPLMKALANRGHQVDYYTPLPVSNAPKGLRQFIVKDWQEEALALFDEEAFRHASQFQKQRDLTRLCATILEFTFTKDQVSRELLQSNDSYDAVITELPVGNEPLAYLAHKFKSVSIAIIGFPDYPWANELAGLPDNPAYMLNNFSPGYTDRLDFGQRLLNFYSSVSSVAAGYWDVAFAQQHRADTFLRYPGWETRPKLREMIAETALILTNSHVSVSFPYPKAPHVKEIAGINVDPKPLPKDLQDFMDDAPHGVIYFSLGSVLDPKEALANGKYEMFLNVFRKVKQKVMWKIAPGMPELNDPKIKLQTWYPQQGILAHKNIKLFITHGGLQSTVETISFGVPCVGIPHLFDQMKDVAFMKKVGMAIEISVDNVTEAGLFYSINEILNNPKYREAAMKQKSLFDDRPRKAADEAVYWIEYVMRHGGILRPASASMPFYQIYLLDVAGFLIIALILLATATKMILRTLLSLFDSSRRSDSRQTKKKLN